jgi:hypothetical protein
MNTNFDDDLELIAFLKQHHPIAPPADLNLQAAIMAQVSSQASNTAIAKSQNIKTLNIKIGLLGAAIVTTLSLVIYSQTRPMQTAFNENERLKIEKSLITNWHIAEEEFTTSYSLLSSLK